MRLQIFEGLTLEALKNALYPLALRLLINPYAFIACNAPYREIDFNSDNLLQEMGIKATTVISVLRGIWCVHEWICVCDSVRHPLYLSQQSCQGSRDDIFAVASLNVEYALHIESDYSAANICLYSLYW